MERVVLIVKAYWSLIMGEVFKKKSKEHLIAKQRYIICKNCDSFNSSFRTCKECGCYMPAKTECMECNCPKGYW